jgi:hypothetical protein
MLTAIATPAQNSGLLTILSKVVWRFEGMTAVLCHEGCLRNAPTGNEENTSPSCEKVDDQLARAGSFP